MTARSKTDKHRPTERKESKPVVKRAANAVKAALKQAKKGKK